MAMSSIETGAAAKAAETATTTEARLVAGALAESTPERGLAWKTCETREVATHRSSTCRQSGAWKTTPF